VSVRGAEDPHLRGEVRGEPHRRVLAPGGIADTAGQVPSARRRCRRGRTKCVPKLKLITLFLQVEGHLYFGLQNRGLQVRVLSLLQMNRP
jgi:hypothetical protein